MNHSFVITNAKGTICYANDVLLAQSEFALAQVVDRKPSELWGGHMPKEVYANMWKHIENKQAYALTLQNKSQTGNWYTSNLHVAPIVDTAGTVQYYVGVSPDETTDIDSFDTAFFDAWDGCDETEKLSWLKETVGLETTKTRIYEAIIEQYIRPTEQTFAARKDDRKLIDTAKENHAAFDMLYLKYFETIYFYLLKKVYYDCAIAEELTQETFLQAFRYLDSFSYSHASYRTYLFRVAHSRYVSYLRKRKEATPLSSIHEPAVYSNVEDNLVLESILQKAKSILSQVEYQVCTAFYIDKDSVREISIAMGKSCNAIKLHLSRARKKLRNVFKTVDF